MSHQNISTWDPKKTYPDTPEGRLERRMDMFHDVYANFLGDNDVNKFMALQITPGTSAMSRQDNAVMADPNNMKAILEAKRRVAERLRAGLDQCGVWAAAGATPVVSEKMACRIMRMHAFVTGQTCIPSDFEARSQALMSADSRTFLDMSDAVGRADKAYHDILEAERLAEGKNPETQYDVMSCSGRKTFYSKEMAAAYVQYRVMQHAGQEILDSAAANDRTRQAAEWPGDKHLGISALAVEGTQVALRNRYYGIDTAHELDPEDYESLQARLGTSGEIEAAVELLRKSEYGLYSAAMGGMNLLPGGTTGEKSFAAVEPEDIFRARMDACEGIMPPSGKISKVPMKTADGIIRRCQDWGIELDAKGEPVGEAFRKSSVLGMNGTGHLADKEYFTGHDLRVADQYMDFLGARLKQAEALAPDLRLMEKDARIVLACSESALADSKWLCAGTQAHRFEDMGPKGLIGDACVVRDRVVDNMEQRWHMAVEGVDKKILDDRLENYETMDNLNRGRHAGGPMVEETTHFERNGRFTVSSMGLQDFIRSTQAVFEAESEASKPGQMKRPIMIKTVSRKGELFDSVRPIYSQEMAERFVADVTARDRFFDRMHEHFNTGIEREHDKIQISGPVDFKRLKYLSDVASHAYLQAQDDPIGYADRHLVMMDGASLVRDLKAAEKYVPELRTKPATQRGALDSKAGEIEARGGEAEHDGYLK